MYRLNHNDALDLEQEVRKLFKCKSGGVCGLVNADRFERRPIDAAVMVVSYIYAKELQNSENQYDKFLTEYNNIFEFPDEGDAEHQVKNYISELKKIVEECL